MRLNVWAAAELLPVTRMLIHVPASARLERLPRARFAVACAATS
jgi:hypothetical protein